MSPPWPPSIQGPKGPRGKLGLDLAGSLPCFAVANGALVDHRDESLPFVRVGISSVDLFEAGLRHLAGDVLRDEDPHVVTDVLREFLALGAVLTKMESVVHRYRVRNAGDRDGLYSK